MSDEKILGYFDINDQKAFDRFSILLFSWMDFGISIFYFLEMLSRLFPINITYIVLGILGIIFDLSFIICSKFIKNPVAEYPILFFLALSAMIKSVINFFSLNTQVGIEYWAITLTAILLAIVIIYEKTVALKLLNKYPIEKARQMLSNRKINKFTIPIGFLPGGTLFFYRLLRNQIDVSIALCCWGLASIFLFFVLLTGYNLTMCIYFKLFKVYNDRCNKKHIG